MSFKIGCVIVLFKPDTFLLLKVLDAVKDQVDGIFISDNSIEKVELSILIENENIVYEKMPTNLGIAAAQNIGIKYFIKNGFTHVVFLDQDSIMNQGLVVILKEDLEFLKSQSIKVGAIGPRPVNRQSKKEYRGSVKKGKHITPCITEVTELISSASLVELDNYKSVGFLDEGLFIDGVDHEWCWRARMVKNLRFFISEKTYLSHQLGEGDKFFIIRKVAIPTPFRVYYQYRNFLILIKRGYVPIYWKLSNGFKYFVKIFYYVIFLKSHKAYFNNIMRGIKDGLFKK
jgi:rhamnosyltransferase